MIAKHRDRHPAVFAGSLVVSALVSGALPLAAQPESATDMTSGEVQAILEVIGNSVDIQGKVVDIGSDTNVAIGVLHRKAMSSDGGTVNGIVHHDVTEIYYILEGSGTLLTGGSPEQTRQWPADSGAVELLVGPSASATTENGHSREVGPGDVVVIPAGVFHAFSQIAEDVSYLSIRVDPDQVLPAGYVNPIIE